MKNIVIVGAGFSGLSLAYYLNQKGHSVSVIDKNKMPGGMIQSLQSGYGVSETAANGFLNTAQVETFLKEIGANYVPSSRDSKKRFIYRDGLRRWPLNFLETLKFLINGTKFLLKSKEDKLAGPEESVEAWSGRHFGSAATNYLVAPALQGIYAGDIARLSAELILNPILNRKKVKKLSSSSLLSHQNGMGALMKELEKYLIRQGVQFVYGKSWSSDIKSDVLVIATSAPEAATILQKIDDPMARENAGILKKIITEPLISVTQFFPKTPPKGKGFGVLFPRDQDLRPLGVLMNDIIFDRHNEMHSETWILGGALDPEVLQLEDPDILKIIQQTRQKVLSDQQLPVESRITRWPNALPHYTTEHQKLIRSLKPMSNVILHGNYLGVIGLSRILENSKFIGENLTKGIS